MSKGLCIGGSWMKGEGVEFVSINPADGSEVWSGNAASATQVSGAVAAAQKAFPEWMRLGVDARIGYLEKFCVLLEEKKEEFASLISRETGKVKWDALGEVGAMVAKAGISRKAYDDRTGTRESEQGGVIQKLQHRPHGVLAVFGPYNFPGHLPNGHIMPSLIAGNTIVFKPSEQTPAVGERMVALWHEAGLPAGVLNLVQGESETGKALAASEVDGILFTGSAHVGALIHKQLGGQPQKMLALEMGGNNPLIIWEPDDVAGAGLLATQSAFLSSGQRCTCARRLIVPNGKAGDAVLEQLVYFSSRIRVGAWDEEPAPFMGPVISQAEANKLLAAQNSLISRGGNSLLEMKRLRSEGAFISPGIVDVTNVKDRADEEYFGPLLQVIRVANFDEALAEANNTRFGLAAGLISGSRSLYETFHSATRAGIVNWNRPTCGASSALPFGGSGISGNHRPSAYYAADYCAYPVSSLEAPNSAMTDKLPTGISE